MKQEKSDINHLYNPTKRLPAVLLLVVFLFVAVFVKMFAVIILDGGKLQMKAIDQWLRDLPTDAPRGSILDRNGNVLASTSTRYNLYVRPSATSDKPAVAKLLSNVFGYDYEKTLEKISKRTSEVTVATQVTKEQLNTVYESGLSGIYYSEDNHRYYPYGDFMTQVLGFCSTDGFGQTGLEAYYNKYLTGVNGQIMTETDLIGKELGAGTYYLPSIPGMNVITTLDSGIQRIVDGAIAKAVAMFKPKGVACIVMDYDTGGVVALSEYPSFDLNNVPRDDLEALFLHSKSNIVSSVYEPGSTFKILTAAAALDAGKVTVSDRFYCAGSRTVDGKRIRCWKAKGHGSINFAEGVEGSCNCVFMDSALRMGTEQFYNYLRNFGLTKKTGIDMTGETSGIFIAQDAVKTVDLARIGFGQAVAVTPIGLISATSAVMNGGKKVTPHLLSGVKDINGNTVGNTGITSSGGQIISQNTSDTMRTLLESVVTTGSGKGAYVPGYRVAGKTGTAQKYANGAIASGKYISSFLGFSLSEGANYAVLFIVDEPSGYMYYGSQVAAPLVGEIFASMFDYLGIEPVYTGEEAEIIGEKFSLPDFTGMTVAQARNELAKLGLYCETDGEGNNVKGQYPEAGVTVDKRNVVLLIT
ncbi:MAG: PASTA domain-containing protein [Clostridia bacterium]|jgi:stage V sporulation protein D (sporulation-specific penicillin-binding protein)|nr:PASTA domain-containing protein [Clostridia bacterium]